MILFKDHDITDRSNIQCVTISAHNLRFPYSAAVFVEYVDGKPLSATFCMGPSPLQTWWSQLEPTKRNQVQIAWIIIFHTKQSPSPTVSFPCPCIDVRLYQPGGPRHIPYCELSSHEPRWKTSQFHFCKGECTFFFRPKSFENCPRFWTPQKRRSSICVPPLKLKKNPLEGTKGNILYNQGLWKIAILKTGGVWKVASFPGSCVFFFNHFGEWWIEVPIQVGVPQGLAW